MHCCTCTLVTEFDALRRNEPKRRDSEKRKLRLSSTGVSLAQGSASCPDGFKKRSTATPNLETKRSRTKKTDYDSQKLKKCCIRSDAPRPKRCSESLTVKPQLCV